MSTHSMSYTAVERKVLDNVDRNFAETIQFLSELVRRRSTLGQERPAQELVYGRLKEIGLAAEMWDLDVNELRSDPSYVTWDVSYEGRPNVTASWLAAAPGGHSLIFNGHIDVVSPEPLGDWTRDPFDPTIEGDWLYGRGSADCKAGIAAMILAVQSVREAGVQLRGDVILESVIEEESSGNGSRACCLRGMRAHAAIVTEPIQGYVSRAGPFWFRVSVRGLVAHIGRGLPVVNPIDKMCLIIAALRRLETDLNAEVSHPRFRHMPHPVVLNLGIIRAGDWPTTIPPECHLECRLSRLPGVTQAEAQERVRAAIAEVAWQDPYLRDHPPTVEFFGAHFDPSVCDPSGPAMRLLGELHQELTGEPLQELTLMGGSDQYNFANMGMEATDYGPTGSGFHAGDERVSIRSIQQVAELYALYVLRWCGIVD